MTMFKKTDVNSPEEYINKLEEPRKSEIKALHELIKVTVPKLSPYMQSGMIGYGSYHYKYASGREGDWCIIALASQKNYISIYACAANDQGYVAEKYKELLPKASIGKSCIRFKKLSDIDLKILIKILKETEAIGGFSSISK